MGRLFNTRRLLEPMGYVPPAEYEAAYYAALEAEATNEPDSRRGARRHPDPDNEADAPAAERPHDFFDHYKNEVRFADQAANSH